VAPSLVWPGLSWPSQIRKQPSASARRNVEKPEGYAISAAFTVNEDPWMEFLKSPKAVTRTFSEPFNGIDMNESFSTTFNGLCAVVFLARASYSD
jgi:hypothetical protein